MFTGKEVGQMQEYLNGIVSGKKEKYFYSSPEADPEWGKSFPVFERLVDYAVSKIDNPEENNNYKAFKKTSSDSKALFKDLYQHTDSFNKVLETYILKYRP